jgi:hypothetical protein
MILRNMAWINEYGLAVHNDPFANRRIARSESKFDTR